MTKIAWIRVSGSVPKCHGSATLPDPWIKKGTGSRIRNTGRTKKEMLAWIPAATAAAQTASIRRLRTEWALALVTPARRPPAQDNTTLVRKKLFRTIQKMRGLPFRSLILKHH